MESLAPILLALKEASPWVVLAGLIGFLVWQFLAHRERMRELSRKDETAEAVEAATQGMQQVRDMLTKHMADASAAIATAESRAESREAASLRLLEKIAQELVNLNAAQPGKVISVENAKLIIGYQWNWCRDETTRLLINSIENNHFQGNEGLVSRRLSRAWRRAAMQARDSIAKLNGVEYPYAPLFDGHIAAAWERAWEWAVPLYHRDVRDVEAAVEDLRDRVRLLFDDILASYFRIVEDIDRGSLYNGDDSRGMRPVSESGLHPVDETGIDFVDGMVSRLKGYQPGTRSATYDALRTRREVEEVHARRKHPADEDSGRITAPARA